MIRNLVLKLPSLKVTSENVLTTIVRKRSFRSLSPVKSVSPAYASERSISCTRAYIPNKIGNSRSLCFSKEYYAKPTNKEDEDKEVQWREDPTQQSTKGQAKPEESFSREQIQTLEQYELEAARPRCSKSQDLIDAFASKTKIDKCFHLQPCHMRPYGSPDNLYSVMLLRPTTALKYSGKNLKKYTAKDATGVELPKPTSANKSKPATAKTQQRSYSTTPVYREFSKVRPLSTTKSCIAKVGDSTKDDTISIKESFKFPSRPKDPRSAYKQNPHENHWSLRQQLLVFSPPNYQDFNEEFSGTPPLKVEMSTPAERRRRKEEENKKGSKNFRSCYSDLIKTKLKKCDEDLANNVSCALVANKDCVPCLAKNSPNSENRMLKALKFSSSSTRGLLTRSKSDMFEEKVAASHASRRETQQSRSFSKLSSPSRVILSKMKKEPKNHPLEQPTRTFAKCDKDYIRAPKKPPKKCVDICDPVRKAMGYKKKKRIPFEPEKCVDEEERNRPKKIFLPSKVRLPVPPCTPRPPYEDCTVPELCPDRADMCLEIKPKRLPKLPLSDCPCIDPPIPSKSPRLDRLCFKFEDPPRGICHPPPCTTPRADDANPYKHKPLKPYEPKDCDCIVPPPMISVKMKRLPKCFPEEVCRPVRVCPPEDKCPPRADECYKVVPKKLPPIEGDCPCIDPPMPTVAPPIKRLCLDVPDPPRICKKPPPCDCVDRADACQPPKKKKLPKFVPGDCPCEDRPMVDWNLKRLICEDEEIECPLEIPDPCKDFPRADWGCWEYSEDTCAVLDEKCVNIKNPCDPPPQPKPCRRKDICIDESAGPLSYTKHVPRRKFSNASLSSSLKLYENLKNNKIDNPTFKLTSKRTVVSSKSKGNKSTKKSKSITTLPGTLKKIRSAPVLNLIKKLNSLDYASETPKNDFLFKPRKDETINYKKILSSIATSSVNVEKKPVKPGTILASFKKPKPPNPNTLTVTSRAISTTEHQKMSEQEMKKSKDCKAKAKCKKIKPSIKSLMCKKPCPKLSTCSLKCTTSKAKRLPGCKFERIPVCCEKEEAPYTAFSDNFPDTIRPFLTKTPQWNCERQQYGYYPVGRKENEGLDLKNKKNKNKKYSTSAGVSQVTGSPEKGNKTALDSKTKTLLLTHPSTASTIASKPPQRLLTSQSPLKKEFLKRSTVPDTSCSQSRSIATKVFEIHFPKRGNKPKASAECSDSFEVSTAPAISCETVTECEADQRWCCKRQFTTPPNTPRRAPPFPAFSDCLDEEMEDILTECPLDKEKYLKLQPRFTHLARHPLQIKPPPPNQGKIDLLKEQNCLREKLCMENTGVSQSCTEFGKPVQLLRSKNVVTEGENWDCKRLEELKKLGRWPPHSSYKNRRYYATAAQGIRSYSTLGCGNFSEKVPKTSNAKRVYVRDFHALTKTDKTVLKDSEENIKEMAQKLFPNIDESTKFLKLKNNQWRLQNLMAYEKLNKQCNLAKSVKRFYCSYKTKRRNVLAKKTRLAVRRGFTTGRRFSLHREKCKIKSEKRSCPKFILKNCPPKARRKPKCEKIIKVDCVKPDTPYPAFSDSHDSELITPSCECPYNIERMEDLQPRYSPIHAIPLIMKTYPNQDHINKHLGREYYKCKYGIPTTGQTIGCDAFGECVYTRDGESTTCDKLDQLFRKCRSKNSCENVEVLVQDHQDSTCCSADKYCDAEREKLKELCIQECLKSVPCTLPEEEKYSICKERCSCLLEELKNKVNAPSCEDAKEPEVVAKRPVIPMSEDCNLQQARKIRSVRCINVPKRTKSLPCKEVREEPCEKFCEKVLDPEPCKPAQPKKSVICQDVKPPVCTPQPSKSFTQLESLWQKVVNYFKARPNCPSPGEYRKQALKDKAEKAAKKAGLIVVDPNCLPDDIVESFKAPKKDCKVCPNQDPCDGAKGATRSSSPEPNRRTYSTSSRNFTRSLSCDHLNEINKMIAEAEMKEKQLLYQNYQKQDSTVPIFPERKDAKTSEAMKMSLDLKLGKKWVNMSELCRPENYQGTYFGYSDIIPSRENVLERAWRISIEAYNKHNYPKTYNFFNEFFTRVEKSVNSMEDLEKIKTETVLRELDEFLQCDDFCKKKK